jgi:tetratricopeptide (TPR) repeat protein
MDFADADIHEGSFTQALAHAQDLVDLGQDSGDRVVLGWGLARQGYAQKGLGKLVESIGSLKKAMELLKSVPEYITYVDCGGELGQCYLRLGEIEQAFEAFEECRRLRKEHNLLRSPVCTRFINGLAEAYLLSAERGTAAGEAG